MPLLLVITRLGWLARLAADVVRAAGTVSEVVLLEQNGYSSILECASTYADLHDLHQSFLQNWELLKRLPSAIGPERPRMVDEEDAKS